MKPKQFIVIGLGRFGSSLARELHSLGYEVLGIDKDAEAVKEISSFLTHAALADSTDEPTLRSLGIRNFDCAVIAIGDDIQASIMTAILLKELGVKMVVAKALSLTHGKVLDKIGVDRIIFPERDMGVRVAHQLVTPNLLDYIELSKDYTLAELSVPARITGKTLGELNIRARFGCSMVAINKKTGGMVIAPSAHDVLEETDVMIIIGTNEQVEAFEEMINEE